MAGIPERIQTGRMGVPIPNPERSGSGFGIGTQTARRVAPICTSFAKEGVALRLRSGSSRWRGQRETPTGRDVMAMVECGPPSNASYLYHSRTRKAREKCGHPALPEASRGAPGPEIPTIVCPVLELEGKAERGAERPD